MNLEELHAELRKDPEYLQAEKELRFKIRLAKAVLYARMAKGWSQTELARQVQTRQANISRIESSIANPTLDLIRRICDVLDIELAFSGPQSVVVEPDPKQHSETTTGELPEELVRVDNQSENLFHPQYTTKAKQSYSRGDIR